MDKKYSKLAVLGIICFIVALAAVILFLPGNPLAVDAGFDAIGLKPYFVDQYLEKNPNVMIPIAGRAGSSSLIISDQGFSQSELAIKGSIMLWVTNSSSSICRVIVSSPGLDGETYNLSQFPMAQGEKQRIVLAVPKAPEGRDYVALAEDLEIQTTEKGVLVFEVSSTNCGGENNYLAIYAKTA